MAGLSAEWVVLNFCKGWWRWLCASMRDAGAVSSVTGGGDAAVASDDGAAGVSCSTYRANSPYACVDDAFSRGWLGDGVTWSSTGATAACASTALPLAVAAVPPAAQDSLLWRSAPVGRWY
jgi:hypothetical protein